MSSVITSSQRGAAAPERPSTEWLRCPGERTALVVSIASNLVVLALAIAVVLAGTAWLGTHPIMAKHVGWVRVALLAAVLALPATVFGRHIEVHAARKNGLRVGEEQFPELHDELLRACRKLGVEQVPELYLSRSVKGPAAAYSLWHRQSVIVLDAELFDLHWRDGIDWLSFVVAGALGSIHLGHTRWWIELLTTYSRRVPGLRTPLLLKCAFSRDCCAAFAVPDGLRGLLVEALGKHATQSVAFAPFIEQTERAAGSPWDVVATFRRKAPLLTARARALYDAGLFDRARDRERSSAVTPPEG